MRLSLEQLRQLAAVVERIDEGRIDTPRVPGPIGLFLRQYADARAFAAHHLGVPGDSPWVSGAQLMPIDLVLITRPEMQVHSALIGSATTAVAACETIGTTVRVTLWGSARAANRLLRLWRRQPTAVASLSESYRWYPPARITPGEARIESTADGRRWDRIRCIKYTGDDLGRAPHAGAVHLDWLSTPQGFKAFRTFAIRRVVDGWSVLPGLTATPRRIVIRVPENVACSSAQQLLVLAWATPWTPHEWHVLDAVDASDDDVLAHGIAWADHLLEVRGAEVITGDEMRALEERLRSCALRPSIDVAVQSAALRRDLNPAAQTFAAWLRGVT